MVKNTRLESMLHFGLGDINSSKYFFIFIENMLSGKYVAAVYVLK